MPTQHTCHFLTMPVKLLAQLSSSKEFPKAGSELELVVLCNLRFVGAVGSFSLMVSVCVLHFEPV